MRMRTTQMSRIFAKKICDICVIRRLNPQKIAVYEYWRMIW
jgi:hypothetical protein